MTYLTAPSADPDTPPGDCLYGIMTEWQYGNMEIRHKAPVTWDTPILSLSLAGSCARVIFLPVRSGHMSIIRHLSTDISLAVSTICSEGEEVYM